jgi:hypothetical protein
LANRSKRTTPKGVPADYVDTFSLDRKLAGMARSQRGFLRALREGTAEEHAFDFTARPATAALVRDLGETAAVDPLAKPLQRWLYRLYEERALADFSIALARSWYQDTHELDRPVRGTFTLSALRRSMLAERGEQRVAFCHALLDRGSKAIERFQRHSERRAELAAQAGLSTALAFERPSDTVPDAASRLLDGTRDALATLGLETLPQLLETSLGRQPTARFPSRLTPRSLAELLDARGLTENIELSAQELPAALGASSFLIGLDRLGAAIRAAHLNRSLPFATTHEPYALPERTYGSLFALLALNPVFAERRLDLDKSRRREHGRSTGAIVLLRVRSLALRVRLAGELASSLSGFSRAYPEETYRALGIEVSQRAAGLLFTPRPGDDARLAGLLLALALEAELTETHDEDWFRNPRAIEELRERARLPIEAQPDGDALARGEKLLVERLTDWL